MYILKYIKTGTVHEASFSRYIPNRCQEPFELTLNPNQSLPNSKYIRHNTVRISILMDTLCKNTPPIDGQYRITASNPPPKLRVYLAVAWVNSHLSLSQVSWWHLQHRAFAPPMNECAFMSWFITTTGPSGDPLPQRARSRQPHETYITRPGPLEAIQNPVEGIRVRVQISN